MKYMGLNELREAYLAFFESKEHLRMPSFSLVPKNDNSLLLINAGMAPLKPYFTGQEIPPRRRVTTCQKCIRTGDIDNVGKTARHGTFFEMLGNFSFGDYFKREALHWSWEFLTEVVGMDKDRLYPSVYTDDDEAYKIWNEEIGVPAERIYRFGKEDNFWEHGEGPCGPCSEIYYDRGEKYGCGKPTCGPGCDCDRFMEIWNDVFTQFYGDGKGNYTELAQKNIDTGMGLERLAVAVQDVNSMFDVDTLRAIREDVCKIAGVGYEQGEATAKTDVSVRVITDHVRSLTFMISDGILPSNEGRGYVLRRLLRRAARHGRLLGITRPFIVEVADTVIGCSADAYPELREKQEYINKIITNEEENFYKTLDQGLAILQDDIAEAKKAGSTRLDGSKAFRLYDTYGFPLDLTREILEEQGMEPDEEGFRTEMEAQRVRARSARKKTNYMGAEATVYNQLDAALETEFDGYDRMEQADSTIIALTGDTVLLDTANAGDSVTVFTDKTPFYAEMGGQTGDIGYIRTETGTVKVTATIHAIGSKTGHVGEVTEGFIEKGQKAEMLVDQEYRLAVSRNHSATHLLQKALRNVLGTHVQQSGSLVDAEHLRFDFTHFEAVSKEDLRRIEREVNREILAALPIRTEVMTLDEARKTGAMALFGEKYGDTVRVVCMGDYSKELCGGTHLTNTSRIGYFRITSESASAAGVRRITAVTGEGALAAVEKLEDELDKTAGVLKAQKDSVAAAAEALQKQLRELQKELESLKSKMTAGQADEMLAEAETKNGIAVLAVYRSEMNADALKSLGDSLKEKLGESVVILAGGTDALSIVVMATDGAVKKGVHAGKIIKTAMNIVDGRGGGRPNMAQGGGKNAARVQEALAAAKEEAAAEIQ